MGIGELVEWLEKLEARNNTYWNFYTVVLVAVCGWVVSRSGTTVPANAEPVLVIGLLVFFLMNLAILYGTTARIRAVETEIRRRLQDDADIGEVLRAHLARPLLRYRVRGTVALHLVMDALVLAFVVVGLDAGG